MGIDFTGGTVTSYSGGALALVDNSHGTINDGIFKSTTNIGVVIKENNKYKQGPKDFSKYFQKYSLSDYDKMLTDFVPFQNKTLMQNQLKKLNSSLNNEYMSTAPNKSININTKFDFKVFNKITIVRILGQFLIDIIFVRVEF